MTLGKYVLIVAALISGAGVLRQMNISPADLWRMAQGKTEQFSNDSKALVSGDYQARIAEKLNAEAAKLEPKNGNVGNDNDGLNRELAEARKRMLEDRAAALDKLSTEILKGDVESMKRQVAENARNAGGRQ